MIRVTFYFLNGNEQSSHDCATVEEAFERMVRTGMQAIAHPVGTTCGCYNYDPHKEGHTLEGFKRVMARCCNSASEYTERGNRDGSRRPDAWRG